MEIDLQIVWNMQFDETELIYKISHVLPGELELALIEASKYYLNVRFYGEYDGETLRIKKVTNMINGFDLLEGQLSEMRDLAGNDHIVWPI